ncbi:MAG: hydrogenase maturation nickel metallochaperone HypA [Clostridia bacterium]
MKALLEVVGREAAREGIRAVRRITISFSPASDLFLPALREAFEDVAVGDSLLRKATLDLEERLVTVRCLSCGWERESRDLFDTCAECGGRDLMKLEEEDLRLEFFEAEAGDIVYGGSRGEL